MQEQWTRGAKEVVVVLILGLKGARLMVGLSCPSYAYVSEVMTRVADDLAEGKGSPYYADKV